MPPAAVFIKFRRDESTTLTLFSLAVMLFFQCTLYPIAFSGHESRQFMHPTQRSKSRRCSLKSMQFALQTPSHVPQTPHRPPSILILKNEILDNSPKNIPTGQITLQYQRFLTKLRSAKKNNRPRDRNNAPLKPAKILPLSPKGSSRLRKNMLRMNTGRMQIASIEKEIACKGRLYVFGFFRKMADARIKTSCKIPSGQINEQ